MLEREVLPTDWKAAEDLYTQLIDIASQIEHIRILLYNNRAHQQLLEPKEIRAFDTALWKAQALLWADGKDYFGANTLKKYC